MHDAGCDGDGTDSRTDRFGGCLQYSFVIFLGWRFFWCLLLRLFLGRFLRLWFLLFFVCHRLKYALVRDQVHHTYAQWSSTCNDRGMSQPLTERRYLCSELVSLL